MIFLDGLRAPSAVTHKGQPIVARTSDPANRAGGNHGTEVGRRYTRNNEATDLATIQLQTQVDIDRRLFESSAGGHRDLDALCRVESER